MACAWLAALDIVVHHGLYVGTPVFFAFMTGPVFRPCATAMTPLPAYAG